jgi:hypothetical protein
MRSFVSIWCLMLALVVSGAAGAVCAPGSRVESAAEGPLMAGNSAQSWIVSNRFQITRATSNCEQVFNVYNPWRHGDMKDVAFLYTWPAYEAMVSTSNLNKEPEP